MIVCLNWQRFVAGIESLPDSVTRCMHIIFAASVLESNCVAVI